MVCAPEEWRWSNGASPASLLRHAGRGAAFRPGGRPEHIVQSALSQQLQRLERELGVRLLERSTHHVGLTRAGVAFLVEARQILAHVDRAAQVGPHAAESPPSLRVGIIDASYDSMPQILHEVQARYPDLVIHQVEAGVPEQYQRLVDGRLDVGIGRAALAPPKVASRAVPPGPAGGAGTRRPPLRSLEGVPVAALAGSRCCSPRTRRHRSSTSSSLRCAGRPGSRPPCTRAPWRASAPPPTWSPRDAASCVPSSCVAALPGTTWRPLIEPVSQYPWSILWRAVIPPITYAPSSPAQSDVEATGLAHHPGPTAGSTCSSRSPPNPRHRNPYAGIHLVSSVTVRWSEGREPRPPQPAGAESDCKPALEGAR